MSFIQDSLRASTLLLTLSRTSQVLFCSLNLLFCWILTGGLFVSVASEGFGKDSVALRVPGTKPKFLSGFCSIDFGLDSSKFEPISCEVLSLWSSATAAVLKNRNFTENTKFHDLPSISTGGTMWASYASNECGYLCAHMVSAWEPYSPIGTQQGPHECHKMFIGMLVGWGVFQI